MRVAITALLISIMLVSGTPAAMASDSFDPSFGDGGFVLADFEMNDGASAILVDDAGRILVAGTSDPGISDPSYGVVLRYLADGSPDVSFGTNGYVALVPPGGAFRVAELAVDPSGRVIVVGTVGTGSSAKAMVARVGASGALDATFGVSGFAPATFGQAWANGLGIATQDDGKIVVVGDAESDFAVARLQASGELDTTFSDDGFLVEVLSNLYSHAVSVAIDTAGNILVGGDVGGPPVPTIRRYDTNGTLDIGFGTDGVAYRPAGYAFHLADIDIQSDGKISMSGAAQGVKSWDGSWSLVKFLPDGAVETDFGDSGRVWMRGVAIGHEIAPDGQIYVAAWSTGFDPTSLYPTTPSAIIRFAPDGSFQGAASLPVGDTVGRFVDVAVLDDGGVLGAGFLVPDPMNPQRSDLLVAKASGFNMPPTAAGSTLNVADTLPVGSVIGSLDATDDGLGNALSFTAYGGDTDVLGIHAATGDVLLLSPLASTVDTQHQIDVRVSDGYLWVSTTIDVNVLQAQRFADVAESSLFFSEIDWIAERQITYGCNVEHSLFCPVDRVTRGQMAAFLVRALKLPPAPSAGFVDTVGTTFEEDIDRLAAAGITKGCNPPANNRFCPDDEVRREVLAAFLVRALKYTDNGGGDLFDDDNGSIFESDIDKLATAGVTKGCNPPVNDRFCPTRTVTRGQIAAFLHRALRIAG